MFYFNSWCGFCLRMRGEGLFRVGLGSRVHVGLKKTATSGVVSVCACAGSGFFSAGLCSRGRGIEKTTTSGLRILGRGAYSGKTRGLGSCERGIEKTATSGLRILGRRRLFGTRRVLGRFRDCQECWEPYFRFLLW